MKNAPKPVLELECIVCKTKFESSRPWSKFCGEKCRNLHNNDLRDMKKGDLPAPKCPYCKNDEIKLLEKIGDSLYLCVVCTKEFKYEPS